MITLDDFKEWFNKNYNEESMIEYLVYAYLDDNPFYSPYGYVKIGGKNVPIGDVSEIVDEWFVGNYNEYSDLINDCTNWLIEYIKSIDEGKVLKVVKEKIIYDKINDLEKDFTNA